MEVQMALPDVVTREQWLAARTGQPAGRAPRLHGADPTFTG
jgi:hypothetical protein